MYVPTGSVTLTAEAGISGERRSELAPDVDTGLDGAASATYSTFATLRGLRVRHRFARVIALAVVRALKLIAMVGCICASGSALAEPDRDWHAGLNLRTELGTRPLRIDGGARLGEVDLVLVVDPWFWTDGQHDTDLLVTWRFSEDGWGVLGGWRPTAIGLDGGHQLQHNLLVGFVGPLPRVGPVRVQWGIELAALIVKHGAGLPTDTLSLASARDLGDHLNLAMFARFEYAHAF